MLTFFVSTITNFFSLLIYLFLQIWLSSKINNYPFSYKTKQDSADFCWNLKGKTKTKDKEILEKNCLHNFCSSILPMKGEGILQTFAMWSTQSTHTHTIKQSNKNRWIHTWWYFVIISDNLHDMKLAEILKHNSCYPTILQPCPAILQPLLTHILPLPTCNC